MSGLRTRMPLVFLSTAVPNRTVFEVMVDVEAMPPRTYDEVFLGSDASTGWIYCLTVRHANDVSPRWTGDCHAFAGRLWRTRAVSASLNRERHRGIRKSWRIRFGGWSAPVFERSSRARDPGGGGGAPAREAARQFAISASAAIKGVQRWRHKGSMCEKPGSGHSRSPLRVHEAWPLELVRQQPDLTLEEIRAKLFETHALGWRQLLVAVLRPARRQLQKKACGRPSRIAPT